MTLRYAEAACLKHSARAASLEFSSAPPATNAVMENAEKNARGAAAYRACAQKAGIRP